MVAIYCRKILNTHQTEVLNCTNFPFFLCDNNECFYRNEFTLNKSACAGLNGHQCYNNHKYCISTFDRDCKDACEDKSKRKCEEDEQNCLWTPQFCQDDLVCQLRQIESCENSECEVQNAIIKGKCTYANIISARLLLLLFLIFVVFTSI